MNSKSMVSGSDVLLVKLRPSANLGAVEARSDLEPLYPSSSRRGGSFGLDASPQWYLTHASAGHDTPWDQAHARVARQLGIDASDVLFVEPDLIQSVFVDSSEEAEDPSRLALGGDCSPILQDGTHGKAKGPDEFGWHLGDPFSQLGRAREEVVFADPRTRIAHLDTGYYSVHETTPANILGQLEWNFVGRDGNPTSAEDPNNWLPILDNSGHGTGTLSILAGGPVSAHGAQVLGGAPNADIVPIRVCDSVVLLRTSALARALRYAADIGCAVATLSMGGVPSRAWGEAVDDAYDAGLCLCAASGNHVAKLPPRKLVYPARYDRVIAVCGVMADGKPYADLKGRTLEGSFGPKSAMRFALAAYTPNIPWAKYGCRDLVRLNGEGTSSATPQVAAAAALWIEKYKHELPVSWRRVEAVRHALFTSAKTKSNKEYFGNGILQARAALAVRPNLTLAPSEESDSSFAFLRVVTGLGIDRPTPREEMFNIELAQRWSLNEDLQEIVPDPEATPQLTEKQLCKFMDAVIADTEASRALRAHVMARYPIASGRPVPRTKVVEAFEPELPPVAITKPEVPDPAHRRIRVYATDPSLSGQLETVDVCEVTLDVRWEKLTTGPVGEYLEVKDTGPYRYDGVNLNNQSLLAQDGWAPSEGNPQFHQQMVYAVAMKTIEHFELALGRPVLWRPEPNPKDSYDDSGFVQRLEIRPHALEQANAYYSPQEVGLLFGYFEARGESGLHRPGSLVYTCLSHDIIVHETTHAVIDGMYPRFNEPSNPDVLALHEAFADIVALLQHFTIPELLEHEISRTRGDLEAESVLGRLAVQFGRGVGGRSALRSAIGSIENGAWQRSKADPNELSRRVTPHARGA
ncbi:MAG: S8 family serine peptidase, partial [Thermoanaerobaculia bacterium]|nr:S8 family serine peptidase [Thermoanaerobaculia bacterium]